MIDWRRLLPRYWLQNDPTCPEWDRTLNALLDTFDPGVSQDLGHTVQIGPAKVWIENFPYGYGSLYGGNGSLPKVSTRLRLRAAIGRAELRKITEAIAKHGGRDDDKG